MPAGRGRGPSARRGAKASAEGGLTGVQFAQAAALGFEPRRHALEHGGPVDLAASLALRGVGAGLTGGPGLGLRLEPVACLIAARVLGQVVASPSPAVPAPIGRRPTGVRAAAVRLRPAGERLTGASLEPGAAHLVPRDVIAARPGHQKRSRHGKPAFR